MIRIPIELNGGSYLVQKVNVENVTLSIRLIWNWMDGHWYADFSSVNGKRDGVRIVANSLLLRNAGNVLSDGGIFVLKTDLSGSQPLNHDNLGTSYSMYYADGEELAVLMAQELV